MSDVYEHNKRVLATLVEGDAVEFKRGVYSHWGIYIGNEKVIHVTGIGEGGSSDASNISHIPSVSGKRFNKATVRIDNLFHVASGCKAEKNNSKDIKFPSRPVHEIIETAMAMIGDIDYNLFSQNCEHFVSYCRNNIQVSDQKLRLHKRQQNPLIGCQKDDKYDKDKGPDSHEIPDTSHNDNRETNTHILKTDFNDGGPDLGAPNHNVGGNTIDQVSTSEYQKQVSDDNTDADMSTTPVADVRTENYSSGHFSDEKKEVGLAGSEVPYKRKSGSFIGVNKKRSSSCKTLGVKRQNTDPQFGSQSDNKNDIDSGSAGFNNLASIVDSTNVVDVGTVQYSKSRLTDGKTEDCGVFVGDYTKIWSCSRGTDDNPWKLSLYQTIQNAVPQIGSKIYDNSDKDKGFLDSIMHTFRAGILDPYVIVSDFQHLNTDDFSVSDYPIRNAARYVDSFCNSPRHNELKEISLKEVEEMVELESQKMLRLCLNRIGFDGVFRLLDPKLTDYEICAMLSRPCPPLQTYLPMI